MAITLRFALVLVVGLLLAAGPVLAAGGGGGTRSTKDTNYTQAEKLIKDGKYADAIPLLNKAVKANPKSADAYNYLGYSYRQLGQFEAAMEHYNTALSLQPKHLGANEYLGELYLQLGQVDKAEEHLAVLDKECFFGCEEHSDLKEAIAEYKSRQGAS
ncbi:MAG: tetratricopeptide repeat protein [Gammaproteobacteria bacterium]|nr:tetratricopeptide repeat protein [Gammaproteobacteria bacterium]